MHGRRKTGARRGFVYFLRPETAPVIKIGFSKDVPKRVREFQICSWEALDLIHAIPGTEADEERLHAQFGHLHIRGEWFKAVPELVSFIERLKQVAPPSLADLDEDAFT